MGVSPLAQGCLLSGDFSGRRVGPQLADCTHLKAIFDASAGGVDLGASRGLETLQWADGTLRAHVVLALLIDRVMSAAALPFAAATIAGKRPSRPHTRETYARRANAGGRRFNDSRAPPAGRPHLLWAPRAGLQADEVGSMFTSLPDATHLRGSSDDLNEYLDADSSDDDQGDTKHAGRITGIVKKHHPNKRAAGHTDPRGKGVGRPYRYRSHCKADGNKAEPRRQPSPHRQRWSTESARKLGKDQAHDVERARCDQEPPGSRCAVRPSANRFKIGHLGEVEAVEFRNRRA